MPLNITKPRTFRTAIELPSGDTFGATFLVIDDEELASFQIYTLEGQKAQLMRIVQGLDDIVGEDDAPLLFTPELLAELICQADIRLALLRGYGEGLVAEKVGN